MEIFASYYNFLLFGWTMFLPQLLGVLVYFRMRRFPKLAHLTGFLLTTLFSFFLLLTTLFTIYPSQAQPGEHVCGLYAMAIGMMVLFLTTVQIILSLIAQSLLFKRYRNS